MQGTATLLPAQ